jgi:hypothetical protein
MVLGVVKCFGTYSVSFLGVEMSQSGCHFSDIGASGVGVCLVAWSNSENQSFNQQTFVVGICEFLHHRILGRSCYPERPDLDAAGISGWHVTASWKDLSSWGVYTLGGAAGTPSFRGFRVKTPRREPISARMDKSEAQRHGY